jgi:spore coat polysaccharide biosynthesis protein SpsF
VPRIVASIEARMGSSRFPGKVLSDICGKPALERLVRRLRQSLLVDDIVLATSTNAGDDALEVWARSIDLQIYRGSEDDVLKRVVEAQRYMGSEIVVEVTGDCTLICPGVVDMGIRTFLENDCDVVTNVRKPSFPMGADVQVFRLSDLEQIEERVTDRAVREHVSLYFYENGEKYRIFHLMAPGKWHRPELRFQLDYKEDYNFICEIYKRLEPEFGDSFGLEEILSLLNREPHLLQINSHCQEKAVR